MTKPEEVAYHEAGHAVAACLRPRALGVRSVSIEPGRTTEGRTHRLIDPNTRPPKLNLQRTVDEIVVLLAGPQAEERFAGHSDEDGARSDYERALSLAQRCARPLAVEDVRAILQAAL